MIPLILADDFSGACDAAARAAVHGYSAAALLAPPIEIPGADLIAISTESRHLSADAARAVIRSLAPCLSSRTLYKKIDSTLRGPWIDEVDELLSITDFSQAVVCPAFPALGRTVRNGWLWIGDQPFQQIVCPFTVRDAITEEDLARVASEICSSILPVGSAGLARHFFAPSLDCPFAPSLAQSPSRPIALSPSRLFAQSPPRPVAPSPSRPLGASFPWLVLVGSDHPASRAQLDVLTESRLENILINPDSSPDTLAGVFATGGETAARFLRASDAQGITGLHELLPGIPAGLILGGGYNGVFMITKAGGFGAPDAILRAIQLAKGA